MHYGIETLINIRIVFCGNGYFFADYVLMEGVLIKRQFHCLFASRKRNLGIIVEPYENVALAVFLSYDLDFRDTHVGAVERKRAAAEFSSVSRH